jgi:hypothetical protein
LHGEGSAQLSSSVMVRYFEHSMHCRIAKWTALYRAWIKQYTFSRPCKIVLHITPL